MGTFSVEATNMEVERFGDATNTVKSGKISDYYLSYLCL